MDDGIRQLLEGHAFAADVIKIGRGGTAFAAWISCLLSAVGGFMGDFRPSAGGPKLRVALAGDGPMPAVGSDLPGPVVAALDARMGDRDPAVADELFGVLMALRANWRRGGMLEAALQGDGMAIDFVRGRHHVDREGLLAAYHVHGRTVVGRALDPRSPVLAVGADGNCALADGSPVPFAQLSAEHAPGSPSPELAKPAHEKRPSGMLANRIKRSVAGSISGPDPAGMLVSKGEDGSVALVAGVAVEGTASVRFLPFAVQIAADGEVVAQTDCDCVEEILGWLSSGRIAVVALRGEALAVRQATAEIRA